MELKHKLEKIFNNDYPGKERFMKDVIIPIFGDDINIVGEDLAERNEYSDRAKKAGIKHIHYIGDLTEQNYNADNIALLGVTLDDSKNIERSRVNIQQLVRSIMDYRQHLMMVFHYEDVKGNQWRFSYAYKGDSLKDTTSAKRYTYVFGRDYRGRTAAERFQKLAESHRNNDDFIEAFSVESLSDEFFDRYRAYYAVFVEFITGEKYSDEKKLTKIMNNWKWRTTDTDDQLSSTFEKDPKAARDYIKKMFGRIVFLYFLQRKGWLYNEAGVKDSQYMHHLFEKAERLKLEDRFLDDVLEILFFYILNTKGDDKRIEKAFQERGKDVKIIPGWNKIPFLNGGLFQDDDFDRRPCVFPSVYFKKFFEFLDSYNFTIDENDQEDSEIGIDPEMLGRIFENLLEDNKDKGAFYTPKEIVDYMCRESLIAYLQDSRFTEKGNQLIRQFVETLNIDLLDKKQRDQIERQLRKVKICDPAIGSGAFPMGMVNLLSKIFIVLRTYSSIDQAKMKRYIMENNIYGVDIEQGAVDIARLRFWLSMVVDEEVREGEDPTPLPNLHFKIMQGNSLLESFEGHDLSDLTQIKKYVTGDWVETTDSKYKDGSFFDSNDGERELLKLNLKNYYNNQDHSKKKNLFTEIIRNVRRQLFDKGIILPEGIDPSANTRFFLWHTWFTDVFENGGFDIVIGNPPYISAPAQVANKILNAQRTDIINSKKYEFLYQKWDLYIAFVELGLDMLKKGGVETMIIPYPFTNQGYATKARKLILERHRIIEVSDLKEVKVFKNATVQNCILFIENKGISDVVRISHADEDEGKKTIKLKVDFEKKKEYLIQNSKGVWDLTQTEKKEIRHKGMNVLGDFCYISKGMVLNADEKTAKGEFKKEDLISEDQDSLHSRKYLEAKDIKPYTVTRERFLEWDSYRCPSQLSRPTFRELYEVPKILINCLGNFFSTVSINDRYLHNHSLYCAVPWIALTDVENKSISGSIKKFSTLTRQKMEELSMKVSLQYLCAILNSSYGSYLLQEQRGGDYHIYPEHIRNIPIPIASPGLQQKITGLVDQVIATPDKEDDEVKDMLKKIDILVFRAYNLSYEEIQIIDTKYKISQIEYENSKLD